MKILLTNDDGYLSAGIAALYKALLPLGEVTVFAPEQNCSGASNSLTLSRPLSLFKADNGFHYVNGTPTDCVHMAMMGVEGYKPDLVISGINDGQNMAEDVLYSGTVAGATEGFMFGVPAFAFSLADKGWSHLDAAVRIAAKIVEHYLQTPFLSSAKIPFLLNINIPNKPYEALDRWSITRLGKRHPSQSLSCQMSPRGEPVYWIGRAGDARDYSEGTDFHAIAQGQVSITPLQLDLTHTQLMPALSDWVSFAKQDQ